MPISSQLCRCLLLHLQLGHCGTSRKTWVSAEGWSTRNKLKWKINERFDKHTWLRYIQIKKNDEKWIHLHTSPRIWGNHEVLRGFASPQHQPPGVESLRSCKRVLDLLGPQRPQNPHATGPRRIATAAWRQRCSATWIPQITTSEARILRRFPKAHCRLLRSVIPSPEFLSSNIRSRSARIKGAEWGSFYSLKAYTTLRTSKDKMDVWAQSKRIVLYVWFSPSRPHFIPPFLSFGNSRSRAFKKSRAPSLTGGAPVLPNRRKHRELCRKAWKLQAANTTKKGREGKRKNKGWSRWSP